MADTMSIHDRIAALNLSQVGRNPNTNDISSASTAVAKKRPPPPPPSLPRSFTLNTQTLQRHGEEHANLTGNQPAGDGAPPPDVHVEPGEMTPPSLPDRRTSTPALPPRRPSGVPSLDRRPSQESISSTISASSSSALSNGLTATTSATSNSRRPSFETRTNANTFRVPAYDPTTLPPLHQKADPRQKRPSLPSSASSSNLRALPPTTLPPVSNLRVESKSPAPARPSLPPRAPSVSSIQSQDNTKALPPASIPPLANALSEANGRASPAPQPRALPPPLPTRVDERLNKYQTIPQPQIFYEPEPIPEPEPEPQAVVSSIPDVPSRPKPRPSALSWGMNKSTATPPAIPQRPLKGSDPETLPQPPVLPRPASNPPKASEPPPIPLSSRPNLAQLQASKPKPSSAAIVPSATVTKAPRSAQECLVCRDFSTADHHASRFPRESIPSTDVAWLSAQLTSPFHSETDKARVIFTWLHHNIIYDTQAFFSGNLKPCTPASTLQSGLGVCEGFAGLFNALAAQAGLESIVIHGHGKGFGHVPLEAGQPIPPFEMNHAWNAVKIDGGEWKLIDSCWGAGHVCNNNSLWVQRLNPSQFSMSNEEFGERHYPEDRQSFLREDGMQPSWEAYCVGLGAGAAGTGPDLQIFGGVAAEHGLSETSFRPQKRDVRVRGVGPGARILFQFSGLCPHWDGVRHGKGKPYVLTLSVGGRDGRKREHVPFVTDGKLWYLDMPIVDLGAAGQKIQVCAITTIAGKDARGYTVRQWKEANGKKAMSWSYLAEWHLV